MNICGVFPEIEFGTDTTNIENVEKERKKLKLDNIRIISEVQRDLSDLNRNIDGAFRIIKDIPLCFPKKNVFLYTFMPYFLFKFICLAYECTFISANHIIYMQNNLAIVLFMPDQTFFHQDTSADRTTETSRMINCSVNRKK